VTRKRAYFTKRGKESCGSRKTLQGKKVVPKGWLAEKEKYRKHRARKIRV